MILRMLFLRPNGALHHQNDGVSRVAEKMDHDDIALNTSKFEEPESRDMAVILAHVRNPPVPSLSTNGYPNKRQRVVQGGERSSWFRR